MKPEKIYSKFPIFLQNIACSLYGLREKHFRLGSDFRYYYDILISGEGADSELIEEYQNQQIRKIISHAYQFSPFYKCLFDQAKLKPDDIYCREALSLLPVLRKEDIFTHNYAIRSNSSMKSRIRNVKTSGTTGTALQFITTQEAIAFQWAVWWRHRSRFGFLPGDWHINFTGKPVVPIDQNKPPFWRLDYARKQIIISSGHLVRNKVRDIVNFLNTSKVKYVTGYPSQISHFCNLIDEDKSISLNNRVCIFPGAEGIQQFQKNTLSKVWGSNIFEQYGFSEGCGNASMCEYGNYHEDWEFGILDSYDSIVNSDGSKTGKIVATGFANYAFPFLRYEVGDSATWESENFRCPCGRHSKVIREINGRNEDYVITPEGNKIMRFDYIFKDAFSIREAQVIQRQLGSVIIKYVPRQGFNESDLLIIKEAMRSWISSSLQIYFEQVDAIARGTSGKFKPVVSDLRKFDN
jgi:phenylacetate-CoA ligase